MLKNTLHTLWMAPIRGITDLVYRNGFAELFQGIDVALAPFVQAVHGNEIKSSHLIENTPQNNALPTVPQIIGKNPDHFIDLARQLEQTGHTSVNWNLGCPYPTMTKKHCGSGLLPFPDTIDRFLDRVCADLRLKLSIKMRLGLESSTDILSVLTILNRYPLDHITIHPRIGIQGYTGEVDLDRFETCCEQCEHPVIYNGDISSLSHWLALSDRFPSVKSWMLGRGLMTNPCLAEEIRSNEEFSLRDKIERMHRLHDVLLDGYIQRLSGPTHQIQRMLGHWTYWQDTLPKGKTVIKKLKRVKTLAHYQNVVDQAFTRSA